LKNILLPYLFYTVFFSQIALLIKFYINERFALFFLLFASVNIDMAWPNIYDETARFWNFAFLALTRVSQEASDDSVTRHNFSFVLLYDCHCNFLYERFHLSERLCALEEAAWPFIGEHREKTFGNELPRSKDDSQMRSRPIDARVASNATEISSSRLFRYRK